MIYDGNGDGGVFFNVMVELFSQASVSFLSFTAAFVLS